MRIKKSLSLILAFVLIAALMAGCIQKGNDAAADDLPPTEGDVIAATDYSDTNNWAFVTENPDMPVDVFFLYPTTYQGETPIASIDDEGMRARADEWYLTKGSAFETAGNVYMPYYRQVNASWALSLPVAERDKYSNGVPKTDAFAAFEYYLEHYNNGRPFILASHSQGSAMMKEILFGYLEQNPDVARRMVAAYPIGIGITEEDLARNPAMKFAENANDTGVIITYNTVAPNAEPDKNGIIVPGSLAINPISWTRSGETAPADNNLGSCMTTGSGMEKIMDLADAAIATLYGDREAIVCSAADYAVYKLPDQMEALFGKGSYHNNDISFYYYNLRENAENRVEKYLSAH